MKRIIIVIAVIISVLIVNNFIQSIISLWQKQDLVTQAQNELKSAQKEHDQLEKQLALVKNRQFIEEQARDKLFMVKPGEKSVVIPQNLAPTKEPEKKVSVPKKPNWQLWVELFFR